MSGVSGVSSSVAGLPGSTQGVASVGGLVSGLQTDSIIQQLTQLDQLPIQQYKAQQDRLNAQLSAYQEVNTRLLAVQDAASQLATPSLFASSAASSSNTGVLTTDAEAGATAGQYAITVQHLARAHQVVSQDFADRNTTSVGTGTLAITSGGQTTTVTVDSSDNTLGGLRDAINRANTNVGASIVQDGNSSYRLMIYSKQTGTANALTINSTLSGGAAPTFSDLQTAQDAQLQLGSGSNAITTTRSSNAVKDLIPGVTLNLVSESPSTPVTVSVSQDTGKIQAAVQKFVDQYNNMVDYVNQQFNFNSDTQQGGTLQDDFTLQQVQSQLQQVVTNSIPGATTGSLADVGISLGDDGKLTLNATTLQNKLAADPNGVTKLFALTGQTTNAGVQFLDAGPNTVVNGSPYAVNITQAATQARVTAGAAQTGPLGADETLTINGAAIALTAGMTQAQVLQTINAQASATGVKALATAANGTGTGNYLTFLANAYGSAATVSVVSSISAAGGTSTGVGNVAATPAHPGGETGSGTGQPGTDVAGTLNGEAASGTGQILTGNSGNATTDGLQLLIAATAPGSLGTVQLSNGIAGAAQRTLNSITSGKNGEIPTQEDSLQKDIQSLQDTIDQQTAVSTIRENQLRQEFNNLETTLSQLQSESSYLTNQLAKL
jgi:flagellar hook-associated protein 2